MERTKETEEDGGIGLKNSEHNYRIEAGWIGLFEYEWTDD